ncbi:MAG: glutamine--fructose-6-phosphate transaminase (isomerizing) [Nanoarchaeota archaeon]|nr:glutamine--fructose-6-phosphate transaminase (isomerizing) [Nanoarchaeota archaeon]
MCGIIGRISSDESPLKTLNGLKELEYRGYDSYGILLSNKDKFILDKNTGELKIENIDKLKDFKSHIEIGHTRWATHGGVSIENAHPHFDEKKEFYVVMNGIIENYSQMKRLLIEKGVKFSSQTDTEIIPQLYAYYLNKEKMKDLLEITKLIISKLEGEFSFILKYKNQVLLYKNMNPLIIGTSPNELFFSSDLNLVEKNTKEYYILNDKEIIICSYKDDIIKTKYFDSKHKEFWPDFHISEKIEDSEKKNTRYYMEKEIFEQKNLRNLLTGDNIEALNYLARQSREKEIILLGAGTSYHAAMMMHYQLLKKNILTRFILASELKNYLGVLKSKLLVVFSQSGETADLIFPLSYLKKDNEIFGIVNTKNSTLSRFSNHTLYLNCGKEVAVASTKAFVFQTFVSQLLCRILEYKTVDILRDYEVDFDKVVEKNIKTIEKITKNFKNSKSFFFMGRNEYFPLALEGALKLKEISYIHAEGFAGGELKHGSIALVEENVPIVILGGNKEILSNAIEVKTRGGILIGIDTHREKVYDYFLEVPENFKEIFTVILMQLLAFKMTLELGHDPDKPRNLAKSVTVK